MVVRIPVKPGRRPMYYRDTVRPTPLRGTSCCGNVRSARESMDFGVREQPVGMNLPHRVVFLTCFPRPTH